MLWLRSLLGRHVGGSVDLRRRLHGLRISDLAAIDCGCGLNDTVVSRQVLRLPFRALVSVDAFPAVAELAKRRRARARQREVLCMALADLPRYYRRRKSFDVAFCFDVLEHLAKDEAIRFLGHLESIVRRRIIIWLPLGDYRVDADPHGRGNPHELHRSFWSADDLAPLGYRAEVLPRFHRARFDALWAIKEIGG